MYKNTFSNVKLATDTQITKIIIQIMICIFKSPVSSFFFQYQKMIAIFED